MIAVYCGFEYKYVSNRRNKEIITKNLTKIDSTFVKDKGIYYKLVKEEDLSDIYSVEFMVFHDFNLEGVPHWWRISYADIVGDSIKIRFTSGILPNWTVEEKNVCTTMIQLNSITEAKVKHIYKRQNGNNVDNLIVEQTIDVSDLMKKIEEINEIDGKILKITKL